MMMFFGDGFEDLTMREVRETIDFLQESLGTVGEHAMAFLRDPDHECYEAEEFEFDPGRYLTDAELRVFFAVEDAFKSYQTALRSALVKNGQIAVDGD